MTVLGKVRDRLLGRGDYAITVPVFDGALRPNQLLQTADVVLDDLERPSDLVSDGTQLLLAVGREVRRLTRDGWSTIHTATGDVTALAFVPGGFAVAVEGGQIAFHGGDRDGTIIEAVGGKALRCVNALDAGQGRLWLSDGSAQHGVDEWREDLMGLGMSGRICSIDLANGSPREEVGRLHHAFGVLARDSGAWFSESWRHRIRSIGGGEVTSGLPGYPSRMARAADGGTWLTVFACRTQLVEFVLREHAYRKQMIATIEPDLWVSPQIAPDLSLHEPLQYARLKTLGIVKPWAPPRSYGLVVKLDRTGAPIYSLHSRVDGTHHGVVACAEFDGDLYVLSKGARCLLRLSLATIEEELGR